RMTRYHAEIRRTKPALFARSLAYVRRKMVKQLSDSAQCASACRATPPSASQSRQSAGTHRPEQVASACRPEAGWELRVARAGRGDRSTDSRNCVVHRRTLRMLTPTSDLWQGYQGGGIWARGLLVLVNGQGRSRAAPPANVSWTRSEEPPNHCAAPS